jgi:uridylate kinase
VLKIGGQSLMDRGRSAIHPLVEELVEVKASHQILIGTGGGTRARHVYALAAELGLPTGVLTDVGAAVAGQNAQMLGYLMARHGVPVVGGVFTFDPADDGGDDRELIARVGAAELLAIDVPTLPIDALVLELVADAKHVKEIQIVNGLTPGNITRALGGEHVGTIIHSD